MEHSWILIVAMIGHVLCVYADRLLLCTPSGQFSFSDMKDNARIMVINAPAIPTPVKEKSSVKENCSIGCPRASDNRIEQTIMIANTITARRTFSHFTL